MTAEAIIQQFIPLMPSEILRRAVPRGYSMLLLLWITHFFYRPLTIFSGRPPERAQSTCRAQVLAMR